MPMSQTTAAIKLSAYSGFTLLTASGVKFCAIIGFTALSITATPLCITCSELYRTAWVLTVSALGMRLSTLSNENGSTSRSATTPHMSGRAHFGPRLSSSRSTSTARISQLAAMLMLSTFRNKSVIVHTLPVPVDHLLDLVGLLPGQLPVPGKGGDERRQ